MDAQEESSAGPAVVLSEEQKAHLLRTLSRFKPSDANPHQFYNWVRELCIMHNCLVDEGLKRAALTWPSLNARQREMYNSKRHAQMPIPLRRSPTPYGFFRDGDKQPSSKYTPHSTSMGGEGKQTCEPPSTSKGGGKQPTQKPKFDPPRVALKPILKRASGTCRKPRRLTSPHVRIVLPESRSDILKRETQRFHRMTIRRMKKESLAAKLSRKSPRPSANRKHRKNVAKPKPHSPRRRI